MNRINNTTAKIIIGIAVCVLILVLAFSCSKRNETDTGGAQSGTGTSDTGTGSTPVDEGEDNPSTLPLPPAADTTGDIMPAEGGIPVEQVTLPPDFPLVPGSVILQDDTEGLTHTTVFTVPSNEEAVNFYKSELPAARYYVVQMRQDPTGKTSAEFVVTKKGTDGEANLVIDANTARLTWSEQKPEPTTSKPAETSRSSETPTAEPR